VPHRTTDDKFEYDEGDFHIVEYPEMREMHITHPKRIEAIIIYKPHGKRDNFAIRYETGKPVAKELMGQYLTIPGAKEAVKRYIRSARESQTKRRNEYAEMRRAEKDAEQKSNASK
jgi:hypothetical protein